MAPRDVSHPSVPECFGQAPCIGFMWREECEEHRERSEKRKRKRGHGRGERWDK